MHPTDATARTGSAAAVFERARDLVLAHDMEGFADLWAADGTMDFPFAPADRPRRLLGREAVREYVRDYNDHLDPHAVTSETVHLTADPAVLVAEWRVEGVVVATGRPYSVDYVAVVTVRDGEIVSYRDYWNPLAISDGFGFGATDTERSDG